MYPNSNFGYSRRYVNMLAAMVCAITAQIAAAQNTPDVAKTDAAVPPVVYRSVFKETSLGVEKDTDNWRKANNEVGKFTRGHVDILKWEEQEGIKAQSTKAQKPVTEPDTVQKLTVPTPTVTMPIVTTPTAPSAAKPAAAPAHKH